MSDKVFWKLTKEDLELIDDYLKWAKKKDPNLKLDKNQLINQWFSLWSNNTAVTIKNDKKLKKKDMDRFKPIYEKSASNGSNYAVVMARDHKKYLEQLFQMTNLKLEENKKELLPNMSKMVQDLMHDQLLFLEDFMLKEKLKDEEAEMKIEELDKESKIEEVK